jgi:peptidyl-prolyl cis-trans isomerase C
MTARSWTIAVLAGVTSGLVLVGAARAQALAAGQVCASVNGESITLDEVEKIIKQRPVENGKPLTEAEHRQLQYEAVGMIVDDLLLQQFLQKNAPGPVPPGELAKEIAKLEASLKAQGKALQDFYKETGQTEAQLRTNITTMLQWAAYVKAKLTDADVKRYFDENRDFFDQVKVRASHIVYRLAPNAPENDRRDAWAKLLALRQEITAGKITFADAAKKYSQCPSAPKGGDLGPIARKFMVQEPFAKAAFALKVNEISDVVQTDYGLHLIQVTERKNGQPADFDKIKDEVREIASEELRLNVLAQQRKDAKVQINLEAAKAPTK